MNTSALNPSSVSSKDIAITCNSHLGAFMLTISWLEQYQCICDLGWQIGDMC